MKPVPAPAGLDFEGSPTFDALRDQSGIKTAELRGLLAGVPCFRCSDNRVRYDAKAAAEAMANAAANDDDESDVPGGKIDLMFLFNKQLQINAQQSKEKSDIIKLMGEPLRAGIELWKAMSERQTERLDAHEKNWDRMVSLIEDSLSSQSARELAAKQFTANQAMRVEVANLVKGQLPAIVQKWAVTGQAKTALDFLTSIDPAFIDSIVAADVLNAKQLAQLEQLRAAMPRPAPSTANGSSEPVETQGAKENDDEQRPNPS